MIGPMLTLALDTALDGTSLALGEGDRALGFYEDRISRGQAETLLPHLEELMAQADVTFADLQHIIVTTGPGSFTGLRVGLSAARALGLALKIPVQGVTTLQVLAAGAEKTHDPLHVVIDARRGQIYYQCFQMAETPVPIADPDVMDVAALAARLSGQAGALLGSGAALLSASGLPVAHGPGQPDARVMLRLADAATAAHQPPAPFYVRPPDAKLPLDGGRLVS